MRPELRLPRYRTGSISSRVGPALTRTRRPASRDPLDVVSAGKAKAAVCAACHGQNGIAQIPGYPHLAGQNEAYLISSLKAYKSNQRSGGQAAVMMGQAAALSDEDIGNLGA